MNPYTLLKLMRVKQWSKNLLILAPLFFAGVVFVSQPLLNSLLAFLVFSFASSLVYILNDLFDRESDSLHPIKKLRPIASGSITFAQARWVIVFLSIGILFLTYFLPVIILPIIIYILLNGAYSAWFKHIPVLDVVCVSIFYIIRIIVGGLAASVYVSPWIILCVLFGSLFVIVGKRRAEYYQDVKRRVLEEYSKEALDFMLGSCAALSIISYGIWSVVAHDSPYLVYSVIFVLFALFKLLNRTYTHPKEAESPEVLVFKDRWILSSFVLWILYVFVVFYLGV